MNKKIIISTILLLLVSAQDAFTMDIQKIVFNDILAHYFLKYFEEYVADENPLILYLNMYDLKNNESVYRKEKNFLETFHLCHEITKFSKKIHDHYLNHIIYKYRRDFLISAFVTREIHSSLKDKDECDFFNYTIIDSVTIDTIWSNTLH